MKNKMISVVIPAYNESESVKIICERLRTILGSSNIKYEIIFIDDGSQDDTYGYILSEAKASANVRGIKFSRNFGKEGAIKAGLTYAKGGCCVIIDCDMQHPPEKIVEMYRLWEAGYEVIEAVKEDRGKESGIHRFAARSFYSIMSKAMGLNMENASDFKLLDRKVIDVINSLPEKNLFFRGLSSWVGFKSTKVRFKVCDRVLGESKWSPRQLRKYAVNNITSFSTSPLKIITTLGMILLATSFALGCHTLYTYFAGNAMEGFTTVILTVLFISSILMISLGVVAYYISKIYEEVKQRPVYIMSESTDENRDFKSAEDMVLKHVNSNYLGNAI